MFLCLHEIVLENDLCCVPLKVEFKNSRGFFKFVYKLKNTAEATSFDFVQI